MREVVIVEAGRSPIGKKKGALSSAHPTEMLAQVMVEVLRRAKVAPAAVGQAIGGCINKVGAQAFNVTRTAWLTAGLSPDVACSTIDSQCGSSQFAVNLAASMIASGAEDVVLAFGLPMPACAPTIASEPIGNRLMFSPPSTGLRAMTPTASASNHSLALRARFPRDDSILSLCQLKFRSSRKAECEPVRRESSRATRFPGRPALRRSPRLSRLLVLTESTPQVHRPKWQMARLPYC